MLMLATGPEVELRKMADEDSTHRESIRRWNRPLCECISNIWLIAACNSLQQAQPQIEQFAGTLVSWSGSLQAEQKMQGGEPITLDQASVPVAWRHMIQRIQSTLDGTLQRYVVGRCFSTFAGDHDGQEAAANMLSLEHLLRLSTDLVTRMMREAGIAPVSPVVESNSGTRSIVLQDVESLIPPAALRAAGNCIACWP